MAVLDRAGHGIANGFKLVAQEMQPPVAIEFGRKTLDSHSRPSFRELEEELKARKGNQFPEDVLRKIIDGREIVIVHGTRYMPVWGYEFWVEEGADDAAQERVEIIVENLVDYIRSIQR